VGNTGQGVSPIGVLVAESGIVLREGIRLFLAQRPEVTVVGETGNGREAVDLALQRSPQVVVMDAHLHEINGIEATRAIKAAAPEIAVLAIATRSDQPYVSAMLTAGASGHVYKESLVTDLVPAIQAVAGGGAWQAPDRDRP